jgi:hypothetical protein
MAVKTDLPSIVAIVSILGFFVAMWGRFGWETPEGHDADIHDTTEAVKEFQQRWICDEDQEELDELLEKPTRTPKELQDVAELADAIDDNDCHRF